MLHKHREGEKFKPGFSLMVSDSGHAYGVAFNLFQVCTGVLDWEYKRLWTVLDLRRSHRMWRPNDMDTPHMVCKRCGLSTAQAPNVCSGKLFSWGKSWLHAVTKDLVN